MKSNYFFSSFFKEDAVLSNAEIQEVSGGGCCKNPRVTTETQQGDCGEVVVKKVDCDE